MQNTLKKHANALTASIGASIVAYATVATVKFAGAAAPTQDTYFAGGSKKTGDKFASDAGLGTGDLVSTVEGVISVALGFLGIVAVIMILIGGFKWMTAAGNDDKVKGAKKLIYAGITGLIIVLLAYTIASFVIDTILTASA